MVFPDVRIEQFLEIRMVDSVPYPLNLAGAALRKGLLYNKKSLQSADALLDGLEAEDVEMSKDNLIDARLKASLGSLSLHDIGETIIGRARRGLEEHERDYLIPIEEILDQGKNPGIITRERLSSGKAEAIEWCVSNGMLDRIT